MSGLTRNTLTFGVNIIFSNNLQDLKTEARKYYVFIQPIASHFTGSIVITDMKSVTLN
jgi:hypothetical protein